MPYRVVIIGNSGSGKSTLARKLAEASGAAMLDIDTVVWEPGKIAVPRTPEAAQADLDKFCNAHTDWIVEGCYGALAEYALRWMPELIFVNPGEAVCLANCRARPWEPHKYASKAEQDSKLEFLLKWASDYYTHEGDMSLARHRAIYDAYTGPKREITQQ
jgi:adenylate kinase family enzyme